MQLAVFRTLFILATLFIQVHAQSQSQALLEMYRSISMTDFRKYLSCYKGALDLYEKEKKVAKKNSDYLCMAGFHKDYPNWATSGDDSFLDKMYKGTLSDQDIKMAKTFQYWFSFFLSYKMGQEHLERVAQVVNREVPQLSKEHLDALESYISSLPEERAQKAFRSVLSGKASVFDLEAYTIVGAALVDSAVGTKEKKNNAVPVSVSKFWILAMMASLFLL